MQSFSLRILQFPDPQFLLKGSSHPRKESTEKVMESVLIPALGNRKPAPC
jgi:hypothetical protein